MPDSKSGYVLKNFGVDAEMCEHANFKSWGRVMPFVSMSNLSKNENHVKIIFDYVKNIGVSALIIAAGKWQITNQYSNPPTHYYSIILGVILVLSGFCLIFINQEYIFHQIDKINPPRWIRGMLHGYIFLVASMLLLYLLTGKS